MGSRTTIVVMFLFILPMLIVTDISPCLLYTSDAADEL